MSQEAASDATGIYVHAPSWVQLGHKSEFRIGRIAVAFVQFSPPFPDADGPWYGWVGMGYPNPFEGWYDSREQAMDEVGKAALRILIAEPSSYRIDCRSALERMRDRDDRNGSLPAAYREILNQALAQGETRDVGVEQTAMADAAIVA